MVQSAFADGVSSIEEILKNIEEQKGSLQQRMETEQQSLDFMGKYEHIKKGLNNFQGLYARYITLKGKIVKAHRSVLKKAQRALDEAGDNEKLLDEMEVIRQIVAAEIQTVHDTAEEVLNEHHNYLSIKEDLDNSVESLKKIYNDMGRVVKQEALYTDNFIGFFNKVKNEVANIDAIIVMLQNAHNSITNLCTTIELEKQTLLTKAELNEWPLQSNRIAELTTKFTILSYKQAAGSIAGFAVEQGIEDGDIILF
jgi:hypothetical protein